MPANCEHCGVEEYMPYVCKFCKGKFCAAHRLPENHACAGLGVHRDKMREEGRIMRPEPGIVRPQVSASARAGISMDALWSKVDGKMTYVFLGLMVATYIMQWVVAGSLGVQAHTWIFAVTEAFWLQPWGVLTNIFAHSLVNFNHILFNGLVMLFFGQTTERLIGTRRFTWLFLTAGVVAGVAQVTLSNLLNPGAFHAALGASGAIQGIMGTLVVLAPTLSVLVFFVIPAPLWAVLILFTLYDLFFNVLGTSGVGGIAHLSGLAIGLAYGYHLRKQGLRAVVQPRQPQAPWR